MADFISNSAILTTIRPDSVLAIAAHTRPGATEMADFTAKSAVATMTLTARALLTLGQLGKQKA